MNEIVKNLTAAKGWPPGGGAGSCQLNLETDLVSFPVPAEGCEQSPGRTGPERLSAADARKIREAIRAKYAQVSRSAAVGRFLYPIGREGAEKLAYDRDVIDRAPAQLLQSFCGVGNPFSLGGVAPGQRLLDFGCGAGFDLYVASHMVGPAGLVRGIDLTREMADQATDNLRRAGVTNCEILHVDGEGIPFADGFFDVVISNGVINLAPDKQRCFAEIFRVLKPGGRLRFADVILEKDLPRQLVGSVEAWSQWIGGTVPVREQLRMMEEAGFTNARCAGPTGFRTSPSTVGALFAADKAGGES